MDLTTILIGAAGGAIVLILEQLYLYLKETRTTKKQKLIKFPNEERFIDENIFYHLSPGNSIDLMKNILGPPNKVFKDYGKLFESEFEDENLTEESDSKYTTAFIYSFKNAVVKITSKNKENIDSLTVIAKDNSILIPELMMIVENDDLAKRKDKFNETKVTNEMVEMCRPEYIQTRWDSSFVLSFYTGPPFYTYYTYFGDVDYKDDVEYSKNHPMNFINGTINGICISTNEEDIYYIYGYELM